MKNILLRDIDGSFLSTAKTGLSPSKESMEKEFSISLNVSVIPAAGLTDIKITENLIEICGLNLDPDTITGIVKTYENRPASTLEQ